MVEVNGEGPAPARIMIVGEAPGEQEERFGRPFVGASGIELDRMLAEAGIHRSACFTTNVCIAFGTPVLMADLTWKPIEDIRLGDKLLAFDEHGTTRGEKLRKWRYSEVTGVAHDEKPCVEIQTCLGDITLTEDHVVLSCYQRRNTTARWSKVKRLRGKTSSLAQAIRPWYTHQTSWQAGYLSGLFDGEGSLSLHSAPKAKRYFQASFTQTLGKNAVVVDAAKDCLTRLGFTWNETYQNGRSERHQPQVRVGVAGGMYETLRFLGIVRPRRLLAKAFEFLKDPPVFRPKAALIERKRLVGVKRVADLSTTTGTFIAGGFAVHNCRHRPPNNKIDTWMSRTKKPPEGFVPMRERFVHPYIAQGFEKLLIEIGAVKPTLIIALGNLAMWSLTGKWGIGDQRGSEMMVDWMGEPTKVIPTYHPAAILRQWSWRAAAVEDLKRAYRESGSRTYDPPQWNFTIRPSYERVMECLEWLTMLAEAGPLPLSFDLETRAGHIACAGIAWSQTDALCVPFMASSDHEGYWPAEQEVEVTWALRRLLTHENVRVVGQNLLYDAQYTLRHWGFAPRVSQDSMISHHTAFCDLPKALDFQASIYCHSYRFWKHDAKEWSKTMEEEKLWWYNCEDCVRTWEVAEATAATAERLGLRDAEAFQQEMFWPVLQAMHRGVRIDTEMRTRLSKELKDAIKEREAWVEDVLGHKLNPRSPKQMQALFYSDFAQRPILKRRSDGRLSPTLDDDALTRIALREPLLHPLVGTMLDTRTLGTLRSTFIQAPLDSDSRMRSSFNICGTRTYRLSSSENAFGSGANLQNLPSEKSKVNVKLAKRGTGLTIPNVRAMFIPDEGYTFFDMDLERADLQVVAWEADDHDLKQMLREGADLHSENAKLLGINREVAKVWVHGTNYGGTPRTMAQQCGVTVHLATQLQRKWFAAHPGIEAWQKRTEAALMGRKWVENAWGYRWYIFDRPAGLLPEALAWIPQSTVAILINRIWHRIFSEAPEVQVLLQVHDSLAGQYPSNLPETPERLKSLARIPIPYADPLIIPANPKVSEASWGECG